MMTKVRPVPPTPASPHLLQSRVAPGIWPDLVWCVVLNCYTIEGPAVSPGSSMFPAVVLSSTSQLAMDREGGRGEAAPHTGDVLTTDLGEIGSQPWEQSGVWGSEMLHLYISQQYFLLFARRSIEM